ncbi:hypothetical protein SSCG_01829 [Streptomyces clavuligerus]|nr:hypothetical protein SSCG_01829 [Streptomyces clavuligerus]
MKRPLFRRCGHAPGVVSLEDQAAIDAFETCGQATGDS